MTVTATVALNAAIYGVVRSAVFAPMPFANVSRTFAILPIGDASAPQTVSRQAYRTITERMNASTRFGAYSWASVALVAQGHRQELIGAYVSADLFPRLGVRPILGRLPATELDRPELLISYDLSRTEALSVGSSVAVNGTSFLVSGVMPPGFAFPSRQDVWLPLESWRATQVRSEPYVMLLGFSTAGNTADAITSELRALSHGSAEASTQVPALHAVSFREYLVPRTSYNLGVILVATGAALAVIAAANLSGLTAAREATRRRERTVQRALGASDSRIFGEMCVALATASIPGMAAGVWLGSQLLQLIRLRYGHQFPYWMTFQMDWGGIVLGVIQTTLLMLAAILAVVVQSRTRELSNDLRDGARGRRDDRQATRQRRAIVFLEIAFAVAVVIVAAQLSKSAVAYVTQSPGFKSSGLLTLTLGPSGGNAGRDEGDPLPVVRKAVERIRTLPTVVAATSASSVPTLGTADYLPIRIPMADQDSTTHTVIATGIGAEFFETLGVRPVEGRLLTDADSVVAHRANVLVNETLVRRLLGGREGALFSTVRFFVGSDSLAGTIVGVVPDIADQVISEATEPAVYLPLAAISEHPTHLYVLVRTRTSGPSLLPLLESTLREEMLHTTFGRRSELDAARRDLYAQESLLANLAMILAGAAGMLAMTGIFALLRLTIKRERHDASLRLALGASPHSVGVGLIRELSGLGVLAVASGALLAHLASNSLRALLFGSASTGASTYVSVCATVAVFVATLAALGWRQLARSDPADVLR